MENITVEEIKAAVTRIKKWKSGIAPKIVKYMVEGGLKILLDMCNDYLEK